jgi:hypothetical protein
MIAAEACKARERISASIHRPITFEGGAFVRNFVTNFRATTSAANIL